MKERDFGETKNRRRERRRLMRKGDGCPSPFNGKSAMPTLLYLPAAAEPTILLVVNFLLVNDVTTGSTNRRANRRALSATDQRASDRSDAGASRRAPDRFAGCVLAIVIATIVIAPVIIPVIIAVVS
jgi:hypothetical protein